VRGLLATFACLQLGSALIGVLADRWQSYKKIILFCLSSSLIGTASLVVMAECGEHESEWFQGWFALWPFILLGFFLGPIQPIAIEVKFSARKCFYFAIHQFAQAGGRRGGIPRVGGTLLHCATDTWEYIQRARVATISNTRSLVWISSGVMLYVDGLYRRKSAIFCWV